MSQNKSSNRSRPEVNGFFWGEFLQNRGYFALMKLVLTPRGSIRNDAKTTFF